MKHVVEQAQKLAMLSAPLLIPVIPAPEKISLRMPVIRQAQRGQTLSGAELCFYPGRCGRGELFGHAPEGKKGFFEQANGVRYCWMK